MNKFSSKLSFDSEHVVLRTSQNTASRMALEMVEALGAGGRLDEKDLVVDHLSSYSKVTLRRDRNVLDYTIRYLEMETGSGIALNGAHDRGIKRACENLLRDLTAWVDEYQ